MFPIVDTSGQQGPAMGASFEGSDDDQTLDAKKRRRVDSGKR